MREIHAESDGTYGEPRMTRELARRGRVVNHKRVARLMRLHGIVGVHKPARVRTTIPAEENPPLPDLIGPKGPDERDPALLLDHTNYPPFHGHRPSGAPPSAAPRHASGIPRVIDPTERYFFVHVMKTGGSSFRRHIRDNFPKPGATYPDPAVDANLRGAYIIIDDLLTLPAERREKVRIYNGHFPFVVPGLIDPELVTLTLLREPVDRIISYLKHCKRYHTQHRDQELEEIYEDGFFPTLIRDHQVKMFAMTTEDPLESYMDVLDIDDERLRTATANLEHADLVGIQERHDEFLTEVERRFGWHFRARAPWRVAEENWDVSASFRRRIATDNAADVAFYEFARRLVAERAT